MSSGWGADACTIRFALTRTPIVHCCAFAGRQFDTGRRNPNRPGLAGSARLVAAGFDAGALRSNCSSAPALIFVGGTAAVLGTPVPIGTGVLVGAAFAAGSGNTPLNADQLG